MMSKKKDEAERKQQHSKKPPAPTLRGARLAVVPVLPRTSPATLPSGAATAGDPASPSLHGQALSRAHSKDSSKKPTSAVLGAYQTAPEGLSASQLISQASANAASRTAGVGDITRTGQNPPASQPGQRAGGANGNNAGQRQASRSPPAVATRGGQGRGAFGTAVGGRRLNNGGSRSRSRSRGRRSLSKSDSSRSPVRGRQAFNSRRRSYSPRSFSPRSRSPGGFRGAGASGKDQRTDCHLCLQPFMMHHYSA